MMSFNQNSIKQSDLERLKLARAQRRQQLADWANRERQSRDQLSPGMHDNIKVHFPQFLVFLEAAQRNDIEETRRLLESGVDPDTINEDGLSALHQACINNSYPIAKLLLSYKANVNARDSELWTPLHAAATCGHKKMCQFLISKGADVLAINIDGNMPYDICEDDETLDVIESEMGRQNIRQEDIDEKRKVPETDMLQDMKQLATLKANLNQLDSQGAAPLHIACCLGYEEVARFLLESGCDPNLADADGWHPAHIAVCWCQWEILELLIMYGADLDVASADDKTVFSICDSEENTQKLKEIWAKREHLKSLHAQTVKSNGSGNAETGSYFQRSLRNSSRRRSISSVKRSSFRDKRQMARRDAKEEASHVLELNSDEAVAGALQTDQPDEPATLNGSGGGSLAGSFSPTVNTHHHHPKKPVKSAPPTSANSLAIVSPATNGNLVSPPSRSPSLMTSLAMTELAAKREDSLDSTNGPVTRPLSPLKMASPAHKSLPSEVSTSINIPSTARVSNGSIRRYKAPEGSVLGMDDDDNDKSKRCCTIL